MNKKFKDELLNQLEELIDLYETCEIVPKIEQTYRDVLIPGRIKRLIYQFPQEDRMYLLEKYNLIYE